MPNLCFASSRNLKLSCGRLLYQGLGRDPSPTMDRKVSGKKLKKHPQGELLCPCPGIDTYKIIATKLTPQPIARIQNIHLQVRA
jgi:hypothetical protein